MAATLNMTYDYGSSEEHDPVMWVRGHPVYAAYFVVAVFVASMLITAVLMFANQDPILDWLRFNSGLVLHGDVWRIFTYGLVNEPSLWFAVDMLMLVWFGREVEKFLGRHKFLLMFGCLYLLPPALFTVLGRWLPANLAGESGAFAIFVAFATLYPNAPIFFALLAKWIAMIFVALYTLMALAHHSWTMLLSLWATTGFAYGFIRHAQGRISLPRLRWPRRKPKLRVLPDLPSSTSATSNGPASMAEIDALLDKIARSGIGSLTARERAKLDAARKDLKKRSGT